MENQDKTYMWLVIIAFVALCIATGFALAELNDLNGDVVQPTKNIFE